MAHATRSRSFITALLVCAACATGLDPELEPMDTSASGLSTPMASPRAGTLPASSAITTSTFFESYASSWGLGRGDTFLPVRQGTSPSGTSYVGVDAPAPLVAPLDGARPRPLCSPSPPWPSR